MLSRLSKYTRLVAFTAAACWIAAGPAIAPVWAGHQLFRNNAVGGVSIDASGVITTASPKSREMLRADMMREYSRPATGMLKPVKMRMVSLKGLEAACADALKNNLGKLPDEVKYMAGLQRIEYVFAYPEQNDIVLAGPAEGWKVGASGEVVGVTTGRPVLHLDDLLVALRTVNNANRNEGIGVSIDPTAEGRARFNQVRSTQRRFSTAAVAALQKAMGPQKVSITGVPADSHFARVLVAADYRMKRLAMGLDKAPVDMPSYVQMLASTRQKPTSAMPRWWMACNYGTCLKTADGLAWKLNGPGVKVQTEDEFIDGDGKVTGAGRTSTAAAMWAKKMTDSYDELSQHDIVFGDLRNVMDLCIIAAVIEKEGLKDAAGFSAPLLTSPSSELAPGKWHSPKTVDTQCSFLKSGRSYIITASGGVDIDSWKVASNSQVSNELATQHAAAKPARHWWWNM